MIQLPREAIQLFDVTGNHFDAQNKTKTPETSASGPASQEDVPLTKRRMHDPSIAYLAQEISMKKILLSVFGLAVLSLAVAPAHADPHHRRVCHYHNHHRVCR